MRIFHSKRGSSLIHHLNKAWLASRYVLCHCNTCIISTRNHNAFDQCVNCLLFSFFQIDLRASHWFCIGTRHNLIFKRNFSWFNGIKNQNCRHDLCYTSRTSSFIRCFLVYNAFCRGFHQYSRWTGERNPTRRLICTGRLRQAKCSAQNNKA